MSRAIALSPFRVDSLPGGSGPVLMGAFLAGRNPRTLRAYRADLEDFAVWLGETNIDAAAHHLFGRRPGAANALALVPSQRRGSSALAKRKHRPPRGGSSRKGDARKKIPPHPTDVLCRRHQSSRDTVTCAP
jgi:hypothetical protein